MTGGGGERAIERADYRLAPRAAASPVDGPAADVPGRSWREAVRRTLPPLLILGLGLAIWEGWVRLDDTPAWLLPPPSAIGRTLIDDRTLLARHAEVTLLEVVLGFALALIAGVLLAVAIDASPAIERSIYPLIVASQTVPIPALAPLLLVWFGYGLLPKVLVAALVAFFPIAVNTVDGLRGTDREVLQLLRSLGANAWTRFRLAKAPSALPALFSGARIGIAVAVIGAVFGELVGASEGLGYLTTRAAADFNTARVFAAIVVLAVMGIALFALVALAERLLLPWRRYLLDHDAG